jgi:hypothetical protein
MKMQPLSYDQQNTIAVRSKKYDTMLTKEPAANSKAQRN